MIAALGATLGFVAGSVLRVRRREVEARLERAGFSRASAIARGMYRSLGLGLVELFAMLLSRRLAPRVVLTERAARTLAELSGGGFVVATAHVGNWDLVACAMSERARLSVVTKRLSIGAIDRVWQALRGARGVGLVEARGSIAQASARVRAGEIVGMMIDQAPLRREGALSFDFLGAPAWHDPSPALVAARAKRPLVVAFSRRLPSGEHELDVPLVLEAPSSPAARAFVEAATKRASAALEAWIRDEPSSWLWLHRRWKDAPSLRGLASARVVRALA